MDDEDEEKSFFSKNFYSTSFEKNVSCFTEVSIILDKDSDLQPDPS
jgi:hypothetical protein